MAVGHTRYSTTGASIWDNAQPTFRSRQGGDGLALAHNGNLTNTGALEALIAERAPDTEVPHKDRMDSSSDTSLVTALMTTYDALLRRLPPRSCLTFRRLQPCFHGRPHLVRCS